MATVCNCIVLLGVKHVLCDAEISMFNTVFFLNTNVVKGWFHLLNVIQAN